MARLILLRHAVTTDTGKRLTGRLPGVGLSAAGREAAADLARSLAGIALAAVYTSPLQRCRETAAVIAAPHGLHPAVHRGLVEVDYGTWSGRTLASLRRTPEWRLLANAPSRVRFPEGETLAEVQARAVAACEALAAAHPAGTLALVSHGDVIGSILSHYLGMPLDLYHRITVAPASASTLDLPAQGAPRVLALNVTPRGA